MGHYDRKNYIIEIGIRECCADQRYIDFMIETDYIYSLKEVDEFIKNNTPQHHPLAEKIIRFFINYDDGIIQPDRYDTAEPVKLQFNKDDIVDPVSKLSFAGGHLFLKKKRRYSAEIINESHAFFWFDGKSVKPKRILPEYMTKIRIFFSKQSKVKMEFMQKLTNDIAEYFGTDNAKIIDQEIASDLPPLYEEDERAVIYTIRDL